MEQNQNIQVARIYQDTISKLDTVLVGQKDVKKIVATSILSASDSKILLTGNTGVGKTSLANFLASSFNHERISVTSDLLPMDIQEQLKNNTTMDLLYIDEFNRASGKVQSTFIELFAEKQMSILGENYNFQDFYVLATQNMADIAGIFNVPQAVYDRFDVNVMFNALSDTEKRAILFGDFKPASNSDLNKKDLGFTKDAVAGFKTNETDENMMMRIFYMIDNMVLNEKRLFTGSNIRAHKFALKLAKLTALKEGRNYLLPSDIAPFIKFLYIHRIDQNVARITDDNIVDTFYSMEQDVLKLNRKKFR